MTRAIAFVLQQHGFRAGRYSVGYQSCDDSTAQIGNYDFATCGANARAFAADPAVLGVVGTYNSDCAVAELPITSRTPTGPLAMISPLDTFPDLTHRAAGYSRGLLQLLYPTGRRNFVRIIGPDDAQGAADAVLARRHGRRVFVLDDETPYARNLLGGFTHAARAVHLSIAGRSSWSERARTYDTIVGRVARSRAPAVFIAGYGGAGPAELIRELRRRLGPKETLIAGDGFLNVPDLIRATGPAADGMYVSFAGRPNVLLAPAGRAFLRAFGSTQSNARLTSYAAAYAAQATEVLFAAIGRSDGTRASVTRELFASDVRDGILGSFRFTPDGDMTPAAVTIFRVVGGHRLNPTSLTDFAGSVIDRVIDVPVSLVR
jgi:branched-chain amino acid transport system substrate-binding protein